MAILTQLLESTPTTLAIILSFTVLYWYFLPQPIPGIPCNRLARLSPLGDVPSIVRSVPNPGFAAWITHQPQKHQSPIVQIFFKPFRRRPAIVLGDCHEARDLLTHRTHDFDRSAYTRRVFGGLAPDHHVTLPTGDRWRARRRLLQDTMSPWFLRDVAARVIHGKATDLIRLWEIKAEVAGGKPFDAMVDVSHASVDSVLGFSFGLDFHSATRPKVEHLRHLGKEEVRQIRESSQTSCEPVEFPETELGEEIVATTKLSMSIEKMVGSVSPELKWWVMERTTHRRALAIRDAYLTREIEKSVARLGAKDDEEPVVGSALDHIVGREKKAAAKEGREPQFFSSGIRVEIFGFTVAGFETTSTTLQWTLKLLSGHPRVQNKLRLALQAAWPSALAQHRLPTVAEIQAGSVPYLDATIEESLRCAVTVNNAVRDAIRDTTLLGHHIPKGTTVFILQHGPGILSPAFKIHNSRRGAGGKEDSAGGEKDKLRDWNPEDVA